MSNRPKVNKALKRRLVAEAGGKCANPGCPNALTELHHIAEWHVVQTHDAAAMIALCPACHEAVNRGELRVDDATAYAWKGIDRSEDGGQRGHLYVEPTEAEAARLLLGSFLVRSATTGLLVFSEQPSRRLAFAVSDMDIMGLEASVTDVHGQRLARVSGGHYRAEGQSLGAVRQRPGYFHMTHPWGPSIVPEWALAQMREADADYAPEGLVTLLAMEVLEPNLVRVEGVWLDEDGGMVIDRQGIHFLDRGRPGAVSIVGAGTDTTLLVAGPVDVALFARVGPGTLKIPPAGRH